MEYISGCWRLWLNRNWEFDVNIIVEAAIITKYQNMWCCSTIQWLISQKTNGPLEVSKSLEDPVAAKM